MKHTSKIKIVIVILGVLLCVSLLYLLNAGEDKLFDNDTIIIGAVVAAFILGSIWMLVDMVTKNKNE